MPAPSVSIIIPTLNEAENLPELARRICDALAGRTYEILLVDDDSTDGTPAVCAQLSRQYPLRLITRRGATDGLAGAVLAGMAQSAGDLLLVMDADLQHPPESIPQLLSVLETGQGDFALGSRYVAGGQTEGEWGLARKLNSRAATLLARPLTGNIHDPMSGFFALSRQTYRRVSTLSPTGYKIALELICKCGVRNVVEVPIHFARRTRGQSKLCLKEQCRYLDHLCKLYDFAFPNLSPPAKQLTATAISWLTGLGLLLVVALLKFGLAEGVILAYTGAIAAEAIFHHRCLRMRVAESQSDFRWLSFWTLAAIEWLTCVVTAVGLQACLSRPSAGALYLAGFGAATLAGLALRRVSCVSTAHTHAHS